MKSVTTARFRQALENDSQKNSSKRPDMPIIFDKKILNIRV